ncbi:MAG: universal stress protein [Thermoleophilaceae bacterium]
MFSSIVVGTDGSDTAKIAVREAIELAAASGAKLNIVSAYAPVAAQVQAGGGPEGAHWNVGPDVLVEGVLSEAAAVAAGMGVQADCRALRGDPADALLEAAEQEGADLIVVGNRGMTGAKRFLLGSVPNKVSHHAHCSVLIVRTT